MYKPKPSSVDLVLEAFANDLDKNTDVRKIFENVLCMYVYAGSLNDAWKIAEFLGQKLTRDELESIAKACLSLDLVDDALDACEAITDLYDCEPDVGIA